MVESQPSKLLVAGSSPVSRSLRFLLLAITVESRHNAGIAQLVERQLPKLNVAGSSPVSRSAVKKLWKTLIADVAQLVEHFLGKEEVTGSIPVISSLKITGVAQLVE